jgi:bifunctional ADP-heptose synthase (sugar kinase/adenylyltransferase)
VVLKKGWIELKNKKRSTSLKDRVVEGKLQVVLVGRELVVLAMNKCGKLLANLRSKLKTTSVLVFSTKINQFGIIFSLRSNILT